MKSLRKKKTDNPQIVVPPAIQNRARSALQTGMPEIWVDQVLYLIGTNFTHHEKGDPLLDEAIDSAYALLALLVEYRRREEFDL
jgi:hypothetical protein